MDRALIFVNGDIPDLEALRDFLLPDDIVFAADGGLRHLNALGILPQWLIGDQDSVSEGDVQHLMTSGVKISRFPAEKDETDLELALSAVLDAGYDCIRIVAGLGGRLDQTLANISLLGDERLVDLDVRLDDGTEEVLLIHKDVHIIGQPGDVVSLIPWQGPVKGVVTQQLQYPLNDETLYPAKTRGISNIMVTKTANISIKQGLLLCVHSRRK
jgi:thiamine pyrophosphokinase